MLAKYLISTVLLALSTSATSTVTVTKAAAADQIDALPNAPPLPSNHYSGYLSASSTKNIHYYLAESENDPANDPLLIWMNGGYELASSEATSWKYDTYASDDTRSKLY